MLTHVPKSVNTCDQKIQTQKVLTHVLKSVDTCDQKVQTNKTQKAKHVDT